GPVVVQQVRVAHLDSVHRLDTHEGPVGALGAGLHARGHVPLAVCPSHIDESVQAAGHFPKGLIQPRRLGAFLVPVEGLFVVFLCQFTVLYRASSISCSKSEVARSRATSNWSTRVPSRVPAVSAASDIPS